MKKTIKAILSGAVAVALTVFMLGYLTELTERKASEEKYQDFFEEELDFDVLFMGTSHMINAVYPMELWKDYGITSYNFGGHSNPLAMDYWMLENALDYTQPKLVVIDCQSLGGQVKVQGDYSQAHLSMDAFPFSAKKVKAVFDLLDSKRLTEQAEDSEDEGEKRVPLGMLWDFSVYHERWTELTQDDFSPEKTLEKGAETRIGVAVPEKYPAVDAGEKYEGDSVGIDYLGKMINDCRARGIDVLLTYLPFPATEGYQREANRAYEIAEQYDVAYLNFLAMDVVDYDTDCYDARSHMNSSGARKVTDYIGRYIMEHFQLEDHRSDPAYAGWDDDYEEYKRYKINNLSADKVNGAVYDTFTIDLKSYLTLLYDRHFSSCIFLTENDLWQTGGLYGNLLKNIGVDPQMLFSDGPTLAVVDNMMGNVSCLQAGDVMDTGFGRVTFSEMNGEYSVSIDDKIVMKPSRGAAAGAAVIDNADGMVVDFSQFAIASGNVSVNKLK